jgi:hypothetical protein
MYASDSVLIVVKPVVRLNSDLWSLIFLSTQLYVKKP